VTIAAVLELTLKRSGTDVSCATLNRQWDENAHQVPGQNISARHPWEWRSFGFTFALSRPLALEIEL
jgi:hypothetical protein